MFMAIGFICYIFHGYYWICLTGRKYVFDNLHKRYGLLCGRFVACIRRSSLSMRLTRFPLERSIGYNYTSSLRKGINGVVETKTN